MNYPYSYTIPACRKRGRLPIELRARLDKLARGLSVVPEIGCYDSATQQWQAHLDNGLWVSYRIVEDPRQVVIVDIGTRPSVVAERLAAVQGRGHLSLVS